MKELLKAIKAKVNGNATLSAAIGSDIYFEQSPPDTTMPYVTYHFIDQRPWHTFSTASEFEDVIVQFSIFDDRPGVDKIETIYSDLDLVFNRGVLVYDSKTHIGCIREGGTGPTRLDDCWQRTVDYRVHFS